MKIVHCGHILVFYFLPLLSPGSSKPPLRHLSLFNTSKLTVTRRTFLEQEEPGRSLALWI